MSVCCEFCVLSRRQANYLSRGVLPTVVRRCVWSRNLVNEEAPAHWGLSRLHPKSSENYTIFIAHISRFYFEFQKTFLQRII